MEKITLVYFSPTGKTEEIARIVADDLSRRLALPLESINYTRPENRKQGYHFNKETLLVVASPIYAGRLPNKILPDLQRGLIGDGGIAVPICVFGGRSPDDGLREFVFLLEENGFFVTGAAAFVARHAFSDKVGTGRPDQTDREHMCAFVATLTERIKSGMPPMVSLDRSHVNPYYTPLKVDGTPARFLKATPVTDTVRCTHCGLCAQLCPMGSIDPATAETTGLCIKCQACIRGCPVRAKKFTDPDFLSHVAMLEQNYSGRAENQFLF